jgi:hypothetical protein
VASVAHDSRRDSGRWRLLVTVPETKSETSAGAGLSPPVGVVLCTQPMGVVSQSSPFQGHPAPFLLELVDRPFLRHVVEALRAAGVSEIFVVCSEAPDEVRELLGDGTRWGVKISHQLCRDAQHALSVLPTLPIAPEANVLVGWGHACVAFPAWQALARLSDEGPVAVVGAVIETEAAADVYSGLRFGWLCCLSSFLSKVSAGATLNGWGDWLKEICVQHVVSPFPALASTSGADLVAAQWQVLYGKFPAQISGFEAEPGIWLSRNVILHPTAKLTAPVFVGEDSRIDEGVTFGPNAALGHFGRIGKSTIVVESAISRNSWLGEDMEFRRVLVRGSRVWNYDLNTELNVVDPFLVSSMRTDQSLVTRTLSACRSFFIRIVCAVTYVLAAPFAALHAVFGQSSDTLKQSTGIVNCVKLPLPPDGTTDRKEIPFQKRQLSARTERGSTYFFGWVWPGLLRVATGKQDLFGFPPRTLQECDALERHWYDAYRQGPLGVIDPARAEFGAEAQYFECELAELHFATSAPTVGRSYRLLRAFWIR